MVKITIIVCVLFLFSCGDCTIDKEFAEIYNNALKTVYIEYKELIGSPTPYDIGSAELFLKIATNHRATKDIIWDRLVYRVPSDFDKDYKIWTEWYKNNKCWITMTRMDSIYAGYLSTITDNRIAEDYPEKWIDLLTEE